MILPKSSGVPFDRRPRFGVAVLLLTAVVGGCSPSTGPTPADISAPPVARPPRYVEALPRSNQERGGALTWEYHYDGGPVRVEVVIEEREDDSNRKLAPGYVPTETKKSVLFSVDGPSPGLVRDGDIAIGLVPLESGPNQFKLTVSIRAGGEEQVRSVDLPGPYGSGGHGFDQVALPGALPANLPLVPGAQGKRMLVAFNWFKRNAPGVPEEQARVQTLCIANVVFAGPAKP
ncbi:MAG: hypothetical protein P4L84_14345 [Isosphaeraceae bacterium]|nr:hypothetical protein [Isosphaeraceae bacterium]